MNYDELKKTEEYMLSRWIGTYFLNFDKTYTKCSTLEWAAQSEEMTKAGTKHVADEDVEGKRVSTVWLGIDHNFCNVGDPLLFETMVFNSAGDGMDIYLDRYSTWDEAIEGHKKAVQWVMDGCVDEDSDNE